MAQRRVTVEARCRTSPSTRARASRRPGTPAPTTATSMRLVVDVGLERDPPVARRSTARARTPGSDPRSRPRRRWSRSAAPVTTCRRWRRRHPPSAPASSRCPTRRRGSRSRARPWRPRRRRASRRDGPARPACRTRRRWSSTASPSSVSKRATSSSCAASSACGSGATSSVGSASTAASTASSTAASVPVTSLNDDRLPAPPLLELVVADALVLDALLQQHDALEQGLGPRRAAGDVDVDGMIWSTPLVTEYESQ